MLWVPDPGRGVQITNTNGTFCCEKIDCSPDPTISTLAHGVPLTTIGIIESSGRAFQISATPASSSSSPKSAGVTRSTLESTGAKTTSLLPGLGSHNPSQQTSLITISVSPLASATIQSQTPPTAHSSSESVKLGLGISIPIITLFAILVSAVLWLKRRTRRKQVGDFVSGSQSLASYHGDGGPVPMDRQGMHNTPLELGELGRYSRYGEPAAETRTPRHELPASKPDDGYRAGGPVPLDCQGMDNTTPELGELGRYSRYGELTAEMSTPRQELPASKPDDGSRAIRFNAGRWR